MSPSGLERILTPGSEPSRTYRFLSVVGLLSVVGFWSAWFALPGALSPLDGAFSLLVIYALLLWGARWSSLRHMARPVPVEAPPGIAVGVATSFVPGAEPLVLLELSVRHLVALDYPHDTWVLDEGDDPAARALCERLGARHFTRLRDRERRTESGRFAAKTKHGNYNAWLDAVGFRSYQAVALFDPDHVPERRYLRATLGYLGDPAVGFVQAPQVYYNQDAGFVARGAAEETYRYYSSGLLAGNGLGHAIVVGSHTLHRTAALESVGGLPDHDAEDLVLGRRYEAAGLGGVFVPEILALGLTPADWDGYLGQQRRWARAILDLKLHPPAGLGAGPSLRARILALLHGAYYLRPLALYPLYALLLVAIVTNRVPAFLAWPRIAALGFLGAALTVIGRFDDRFLLDPIREGGLRWRAAVLQLAKAPTLLLALGEALRGRPPGYVITPKGSVRSPRGVAALPHLLGSVAFASAIGLGWLRWKSSFAPVLVATGAIAVIGFALLAWLVTRSGAESFEPGGYERRRRALTPLIGPPADG